MIGYFEEGYMKTKDKRDALIALIKMMSDEELDEAGFILGEIKQRTYRAKMKEFENKHWHKLRTDMYTKLSAESMANK